MTDYRKGVEDWNYWNVNKKDFWPMVGMILLTCVSLVGTLSLIYLIRIS